MIEIVQNCLTIDFRGGFDNNECETNAIWFIISEYKNLGYSQHLFAFNNLQFKVCENSSKGYDFIGVNGFSINGAAISEYNNQINSSDFVDLIHKMSKVGTYNSNGFNVINNYI
jgi:hypothetical protein